VWVPDEQRVGEAGEGWRVAITTLSHERGAGDRGIGGFTPDDVMRLARRFPSEDPVMRQRLARAWTNLKVAQLTSLRAEAKRAAGGDPGAEGSGAKLRQVATFKELTAIAMDLLGPESVAGHDSWSTLFLTSPSLSIRGGTDEIQRNIVGERVLGLPGEIRVDKDVPFNQRSRS
jgi:alkylation response protein AidB-like acyl-CoA dehydrogenase